jgi:hypothetical protein
VAGGEVLDLETAVSRNRPYVPIPAGGEAAAEAMGGNEMTVKEGDQLWVPVTVAGVIGEDGYRFWTDDTWFRDGDQLPLNPALPAIARWLSDNAGVVVESTEFVIAALGRLIKRTDDLDESDYADAVLAIMRSLLSALEQPE